MSLPAHLMRLSGQERGARDCSPRVQGQGAEVDGGLLSSWARRLQGEADAALAEAIKLQA
ncbi:MAG: hypothetical protein E4G89_01920 [Methanothrix sp.]|nr:MAG: hypothetical protein E4G89_01920 [Methanothrix sp.]